MVFKNQIGEIARNHRLIAIDPRGHGLSAKPWTAEAYSDRAIWAADIAAVLKALRVERPLIVGWSFGGNVALNYLRECGNARADNYHDLFLAANWLSRIMTAAPPSQLETMQKMMTITMMPPMVRRAMAGLQLDNQDLAPKLTLQVLFIHGLSDLSVPPATVAAAAAKLPDARSIAYPETGHSPFSEKADRFNADVMAFARSLK